MFVCIILHAVLVLVYAAIAITYKVGIYNRPLSLSADTVRDVITVVSGAFTIAYCAVLMLLTQRIMLHEFLRRPQTLTAIHDKLSAWLGVGSSLQTLWQQIHLVTDFLGISMITLYLLLIYIVHTTLPAIFGVTTQNVTVAVTHPTMLARQTNVSTLLRSENNLVDLRSILEVYNTLDLTTVGVLDNMIYDIIPVVTNAADAGVDVNATTFTVDCASLSDVIQTNFDPEANPNDFSGLDDTGGEIGPAYRFEFGGGKYSTTIYPMAAGEFQVLGIDGGNSSGNPDIGSAAPSTLIVATTAPIDDTPTDPSTSSIAFLGCNFNSRNSTVKVNPQSRAVEQPGDSSVPARLHNWTDPGASSDPLLSEPLHRFAKYASPSSQGDKDIMGPIALFNETYEGVSPYRLSTIDQFLYVDILVSRNTTRYKTPVTIGELNWSLGRAFAAVLWYYDSAILSDVAVFGFAGERQQGEAAIPTSVLQERIAVNTLALFAGLGASCTLFVLAVVLVIRTGSFAKEVVYSDMSGLLPILWLLGNEPRLAAIEKPDADALREAGMHEVIGSNRLRQRTVAMKGRVEEDISEEYELNYPHSARSTDPFLTRTQSDTSDRTVVE
ncbi:hypothetical protein NM688_g1773 [Phlebia brevispora]|uniref:Uncharacterized protein n=1 Tax=Phlebia brevispora TaxID=194682 RepID=A0ACC1TB65_9APHY|nr:hypothetical protein NM688_g1773 [Phlebia brevispora]